MLRRSLVLAAALTLGMAAVPGEASAEDAPPTTPAPAAADVVFLRNGGMYRGTLAELVPGDHVTIVVSGGDAWLCHGQHGAMELLIPVAGPFIFAADHPHDTILNKYGEPLPSGTKALLFTSGGLQIAGIGSILAALVAGKQELVPGRPK